MDRFETCGFHKINNTIIENLFSSKGLEIICELILSYSIKDASLSCSRRTSFPLTSNTGYFSPQKFALRINFIRTAWTKTGFAYWYNICETSRVFVNWNKVKVHKHPYIGQSSHQSNFRLRKKSRQKMKMYRLFIFFSSTVPHRLSLLNVRPCVAWLNHLTRKNGNSRYHWKADTKLHGVILIYMLTAIGLTAGGSSTVHIYTQTIHRTTLLTTLVGRLSGIRTDSGQTTINDELLKNYPENTSDIQCCHNLPSKCAI